MPPEKAGAPRQNVSEFLAAIVQSSDDAIYSKDRNAVITSWNSGAERLYGYTAEEAIGQPMHMLIPESQKGEELDILGKVLLGQKVHHYETQRLRKDGEIVSVSIAVSPVHDKNGEIVEAAVVARDVTQRVKLEETIDKEREARASADRKRALELNDEVVQGLAVAKLSIETANHEDGLLALTAALERARGIVANLLGDTDSREPVQPGDLIRRSSIDES